MSLNVNVTGIECSKLGFQQAEFEFNQFDELLNPMCISNHAKML